MKYVQYFLYTITLLLLLNACSSKDFEPAEPADFIPEGAQTVLKIGKLQNLYTDINQNDAIKAFSDTELFSFLSGNASAFKKVNPQKGGLLCFVKRNDSLNDYLFISKIDSVPVLKDSVPDVISETLEYQNLKIERYTINNEIFFTGIKDSILLLSSSQQLLQDLLLQKKTRESDKKTSLRIIESGELVGIQNNVNINLHDSITTRLSDQLTLDLTITANGITAEGIARGQDTTASLINVFKGQLPQISKLSYAVPTEMKQGLVFGITDLALLVANLDEHMQRASTTAVPEFLDAISEIGTFDLNTGWVTIANSIDASLTYETIRPLWIENTSFRDVSIYEVSRKDIFSTYFSPLLTKPVNYAFQIDDYFCFSENIESAKAVITAYKINDVLANTTYFQNALQYLSSAASLTIIHADKKVSNGVADILFPAEIQQRNFVANKNYPISILQFNYDRNFAHVNFVAQEAATNTQVAGRVSQLFSKNLEAALLTPPQFFSNHRTGGQDIVAQDINNTLHLLSSSGKVLWSKKLPGPILGKIHEVDLLRNKKKQLAFTTKRQLHVLDRNGNEVKPFPKEFRDEITQPLAVFDYDNNRKYRFAIVQGKDILLYDSKGKVVTGFTFKSTKSDIVLPPQHFRLGNKDYVLLAEKDGTLNILSRVGKQRLKVDKRFPFSEIPIAAEGNNFVVITSKNSKESISQSGKVTSLDLGVSDNYWFTVEHRIKVTLDDNLLRIDGKLVELPFGTYSRPEIFRFNKQTYVSVTELQEKKAYLYKADGSLVNGFPVYGTSTAIVSNALRKGKLNLLVQGSENEIILYQLE